MTLGIFLWIVWLAYLATGFVVMIHRSHIYVRRGKQQPWWDALNCMYLWPWWAFYCHWYGHIVKWRPVPGHNDVKIGKCVHCETRVILCQRHIPGIGSGIVVELESAKRRAEFEDLYGVDVDEVLSDGESDLRPR
jgi:hypothetical protein